MSEMQPSGQRKQRFTSNVIPPIFVAADLTCLFVSAPIALGAHALLIGERIDASVHVAAALMAGIAFFLIRAARDAYAHPFSQIEKADTAVALDYFVAALLSSAIIWQFGLVQLFSRGLMLLYLACTLTTLFVSRFLLRAVVARLARTVGTQVRAVYREGGDHLAHGVAQRREGEVA